MTGKTKIGKTFPGICQYAMRRDKEPLVLGADGVRTGSAAHMAQDFDYQRAMRPNLGNAVLHVALSLPAEEAEGRSKAEVSELLRAIGQAYLAKMEFPPTQWVLVQHFDRPHPHAHLILNRVDTAGGVLDDSFIGQYSRRRCQAIERELGLIGAEQRGREQASEAEPTKRQQAATTEQQIRTANWHRARHETATALEPLRREAGSWEELREQAGTAKAGAELNWYVDKEGQSRPGVVFEKDGFRFKGGELGLEFRAEQLLDHLAQNQEARQTKELSAFAQAYDSGEQQHEEYLLAQAYDAGEQQHEARRLAQTYETGERQQRAVEENTGRDPGQSAVLVEQPEKKPDSSQFEL